MDKKTEKSLQSLERWIATLYVLFYVIGKAFTLFQCIR